MMTKETFVEIINAHMEFSDRIMLLYDALNVSPEDNFLSKFADTIMNALFQEVEGNCPDDMEPLLLEFVYGTNYGRDRGIEGIVGELAYNITTPEELYDIIMLMQPFYEAEKEN